MSGSLPHVIAVSNHTTVNTQSSGYTPFDTRSDEDKKIDSLNARNAKASSDFVVTISEEAQTLAQRKQKFPDDEVLSRLEPKENDDTVDEDTTYYGNTRYEDDVIYEEDTQPLSSSSKSSSTKYDEDQKTAGDFLNKIV